MKRPTFLIALASSAVVFAASFAHAQTPHANHPMSMHPEATIDPIDAMIGPMGISWMRDGSGTAWQPDATPMFGHMQRFGPFGFMEHYNVFIGVDAMSGPRGARQTISTNQAMLMARAELRGGLFTARAMFSLEPWTVVDGGYPLLLQSGETWQGTALHDRQHPHELFMELLLGYQREIAGGVGFQLYAAASGEPALGPAAFPHRLAAFYDPLAPISHHWLDSTHICFGVLTAGLYTRHVKLEGSWFNGREPDEVRTDLDIQSPDSASGRVTVNPTRGLSLQASYGYLGSPELRRPGVSQHRVTASSSTVVRFGESHWATTAAWGLVVEDGHHATNAALVESSLNLLGHYIVYGRAEYVGKTGHDLALDAGQSERIFHVGNVSLGLAYAFGPFFGFAPTLGVRGSMSIVGDDLVGTYGDNLQWGGVAYVQIRPGEMRPHAMAPPGVRPGL